MQKATIMAFVITNHPHHGDIRSSAVPCGRKRKKHKIATHKRKKKLRMMRHKKK